MDDELTDSPLERLRKNLYKNQSVDISRKSTVEVTQSDAVHAEHWQPEPIVEHAPKKRMSVATLFLLFAGGFFVLAGITTATVLFLGGRSVSSDNLVIEVEEGPVTVAGGKATSFTVSITNNNPLPVTEGTLTFLFPQGTVEADDASVVLTNYTDTIGELAPGETIERQVRAAFFGGENQEIAIPISVEYKTQNSNATFTKKITHRFVISSSPVTLTATTVKEVSSGQKVEVKVSVRSNASEALNLVAVQADYPFGFSPTVQTPEPKSSGLFVLETLRPGEEAVITVAGTLYGEVGEERVFRFTAGALKSVDSREFGVPYMVTNAEVAIAQPFLAVDLSLNRSTEDPLVVKGGESIAGLLSWINTFTGTVSDATISVKLSGDALDPESVDVVGGFYRSSDRTIIFDKSTMAGLASLAPSDSGNGTFTFSSKVGTALSALRNPTMDITVSVSGRRVGAGRVPENISSTLSRSIKVHTDLTLSSRLVRTVGGIQNTGPWPPQADTETTYTLILTARNTVNGVGGASVRFTLPSYVRYTGTTTGGSALTYTEGTREVLWNIGDMQAGASKEVALQLAFLPSVSQKGTSPTLIPAQTISGFDRFAGGDVGMDAPALTTRTETDPNYQSAYGSVAQ